MHALEKSDGSIFDNTLEMSQPCVGQLMIFGNIENKGVCPLKIMPLIQIHSKSVSIQIYVICLCINLKSVFSFIRGNFVCEWAYSVLEGGMLRRLGSNPGFTRRIQCVSVQNYFPGKRTIEFEKTMCIVTAGNDSIPTVELSGLNTRSAQGCVLELFFLAWSEMGLPDIFKLSLPMMV